jgi:hypothetical protein
MAVAHDISGTVTGTGTTLTASGTIANIAKRCAICNIISADNSAPTSVTAGGVAMTALESTANHQYGVAYGCVGIPTGSQDIVATWSTSGVSRGIQVAVFNGVSQTNPFGTAQTAYNSNGGSTPFTIYTSINAVMEANGAAVDFILSLRSAPFIIFNPYQVKLSGTDIAIAYYFAGSYELQNATTSNLGWGSSYSAAKILSQKLWPLNVNEISTVSRRRVRIATPMAY